MAIAAPSSSSLGSTSAHASSLNGFDIVSSYHGHLSSDPELPMPIASVLALADLIAHSRAATTSELMESIRAASIHLKKSLSNPVPATAGLDLFTRFVITKNWEGDDFQAHKDSLIALAREFARHTAPSCREKITELALPFIKDDAVILTHSYSRVVMQVLLAAARRQNKRISVYVTESRPSGLGLKTYEQLTAAGVPCIVVLDSAVAYIIQKVDMVITGAEGVVESGGLLNAVGTYQMALVAKAANRPFFALAESYKFLRLFPLSQYDLPVRSRPILPFPEITSAAENDKAANAAKSSASASATSAQASNAPPARMSAEQEALNPAIDYTLPEYVSFLFSDVGVLTPSGVGDALLAVYGGAD